MRATEPVRAGDTITFTGQVTGKLEEDDQRLLECDVVGTNQLGQTVARAVATISFPS
jgi:acyl dehydratase